MLCVKDTLPSVSTILYRNCITRGLKLQSPSQRQLLLSLCSQIGRKSKALKTGRAPSSALFDTHPTYWQNNTVKFRLMAQNDWSIPSSSCTCIPSSMDGRRPAGGGTTSGGTDRDFGQQSNEWSETLDTCFGNIILDDRLGADNRTSVVMDCITHGRHIARTDCLPELYADDSTQ